ncbi:MAG TPA: hypothetical protein VIS48_06880 [Candidatus Kryptonia bacterium]
MNRTNHRYERALLRNLHELLRCLSYRNAYNSLCEAAPVTDWSFFSYASLALYNGMFDHAMKVLDKHKDSASFFYLYKCNPTLIQTELDKVGLRYEDAEALSTKLKAIRDKDQFHIDRKALFNPKAVWADANITGDSFNVVMDKLWTALNSLYESHHERKFGQPVYSGEDVKSIIDAVKSKGIIV